MNTKCKVRLTYEVEMFVELNFFMSEVCDLADEESKKIDNYKGFVTELKIKNAILELFDEE